MKKITPKDRLEQIFSEASLEDAERLFEYAGLMVRLKRKWAGVPPPPKRSRKANPVELGPFIDGR